MPDTRIVQTSTELGDQDGVRTAEGTALAAKMELLQAQVVSLGAQMAAVTAAQSKGTDALMLSLGNQTAAITALMANFSTNSSSPIDADDVRLARAMQPLKLALQFGGPALPRQLFDTEERATRTRNSVSGATLDWSRRQ